MGGEWRETTVGEAFEISPSRTLKRGDVAPFIPMDALPVHARAFERIDYREFTGSGTRFKNGDTLIARITPCLENGKTAYVAHLPEGSVGHGSTEYIVLAGRERLSDGLYGYYLARSPDFRRYAIGHMEGTSGRQRVPSTAIEKYPLTLPPLVEQRAIAHILGTLDDKIELNRRRNQTLEAMARALFKDWFVDFGPVRAKMEGREPYLPADIWQLFPDRLDDEGKPEGWQTKRISDYLSLAYGKSLPAGKRHQGDVPVYGSGGITGLHNEALVNGPVVIVGRKGTVGSLYWEDRLCFPIDTVFYVQPEAPLPFCYYLLESLPLRDMNTDAAVPGLNRENVYRLEIAAPPDKLISAFAETAARFRESIAAVSREGETLAQLRDTLLPKLISGELRIADAEKFIERSEHQAASQTGSVS